MTASITACWKNGRDWLRLMALACALVWGSFALAAEIEVVDPRLAATDDGYALSADFNFEFNSRLEEAVNKGVVLYFVADFELTRPRWYWFDEKVVSRNQTFRLSYHALTRQYRLSTGALHQSFESLPEALRMLSRLRNWQVIDKPAADKSDKGPKAGEPYHAALRLRLDITQLPKPFQIAALGNREWSLASDWKAWQLVLPPMVEAK